ncbi:hypothetical protein C8R43DRAFT_1119711 [Mycena crocata]|nr:hypothetical protein C8R43DRAFT_1119711 [Mycena crocata]
MAPPELIALPSNGGAINQARRALLWSARAPKRAADKPARRNSPWGRAKLPRPILYIIRNNRDVAIHHVVRDSSSFLLLLTTTLAASEPEDNGHSPHKSSRRSAADDAASNVPDFRTHRERDNSPTNRRVGNALPPKFPLGFDARPLEPFAPLGFPTVPKSRSSNPHEQARRSRSRHNSTSPTPNNSGRRRRRSELQPTTQSHPPESSGDEEESTELPQNLPPNEDTVMVDADDHQSDPKDPLVDHAESDDEAHENDGGASQDQGAQDNERPKRVNRPPKPPRGNVPPPPGGAGGAGGGRRSATPANFPVNANPPKNSVLYLPPMASFLLIPPRFESQSPHKKNTPYTLPTHDAAGNRVRAVFKQATYWLPVMDGELITDNVNGDFVATMTEHPEEWGIIVPYLAGATFMQRWTPKNLAAAISNVFIDAGLAQADDFDVAPQLPVKPPASKDDYAAPHMLGLHVENEETLITLARIATFVHDRDLTFHVIRHVPGRRTWTLALYTVTMGGGRERNGEYLRWELACLVLDNADVRQAFERANAPGTRSTIERLVEFAQSIFVRWNPHSEHWCAYARPCTPEYIDWEAIRVSIRAKRLQHSPAGIAFEPVAKRASQPPVCKVCRNDDHLHFGCYSQLDDPDEWWGVIEHDINRIKGGILGKQSGGGSGGGGSSRNRSDDRDRRDDHDRRDRRDDRRRR